MITGLMPYPIATKYGVHVSRKVVYASSWLGWFASPYNDTILLNINNSSSGNFSTNPDAFAQKVKKIIYTLKPELAVIENEELLNDRDITVYCKQLAAAAAIAPVTNGGLTTAELGAWYYKQQPQDTEFFKYNIFQKEAFLSGAYDKAISNVNYELNILRNLNIPFVNVHYYLGYETQTPGLVRMFKYVSQWTGKALISNEAGVYRSGLLALVVDIARQCEMKWLILYSGLGIEGSGKALPISKVDFEYVIK